MTAQWQRLGRIRIVPFANPTVGGTLIRARKGPGTRIVRVTDRSLTLSIMAICALATSGWAQAGSVVVVSHGGMTFDTKTVANSGTGAEYVYTNSPPAVNAGGSPTGGPVATKNGVPFPVAAGPPITVGEGTGVTGYGPSVTTGVFKKAPGDVFELNSVSNGTPTSVGTPTAIADALQRVGTTQVKLDTVASVFINQLAAAKSIDPLSFSAGHNTFTVTLNDTSLTVGSSGGLAIYDAAGGSSIPGLESFFSLQVAAEGTPHSRNDLLIDFSSNPLLGLSDSTIVNELRSDFTVSDGIATLSTPLSFSFSVDSPSAYTAGVEIASAASLPEPPGHVLLVLGFGCLGIIGVLKRRRACLMRRTDGSGPIAVGLHRRRAD
jgi:hypothetical protein